MKGKYAVIRNARFSGAPMIEGVAQITSEADAGTIAGDWASYGVRFVGAHSGRYKRNVCSVDMFDTEREATERAFVECGKLGGNMVGSYEHAQWKSLRARVVALGGLPSAGITPALLDALRNVCAMCASHNWRGNSDESALRDARALLASIGEPL